MKFIHSLNAAVIGAWLIVSSATVFAVPTDPIDSAHIVSPQVAADRTVTFRLLSPNAKTVGLVGDFAAEGTTLPMAKGNDGVWTYTTAKLSPGIYGYYFKVEGVRTVDPGNLFISSGASHLKSYVEVDGDVPDFWAVRKVPHGVLHENLYESPSLGTTRRIIVYTPPGYDPRNTTKAYPVMYLLHGSSDNETYWMQAGRANFIMDNLLADGKAKPAIVVSCFGHTTVPPGPEVSATGEIYDVGAIGKNIIQEVIPLVDQEYQTIKDSKDRAILGLSMGGYQALTIGLNNPDTFGYVAGFSSGFRTNQDLQANFKGLLADVEKSKSSFKLIRLGGGADESSNIAASRPVDAFLTAQGIKHEFVITPGGTHTWNSWRGYFRDFMTVAFTD